MNKESNITRINEQIKISFDQIKKIFDQTLKEEVLSAVFISDGGSTTNYKVRTNEACFLLKLYAPHKDNSGEIYLMRTLEKEIKVPKVHVCDFSRQIITTDFLISDFIEGTTYRHYVLEHGMTKEHVHVIGQTLSIIHKKTYDYPHFFDQRKTEVPSILGQYNYYLKSVAAKHIGKKYCSYIEEILNKNQIELSQINESTVRTHGDLNPGNILVDVNNELWFIDFEYGHATSPYLDFGKFLRKRDHYSCHLTDDILNALTRGYDKPLRSNWIHLAMIADIPAMLRMIDREDASSWRINDIKRKILDLYQDVDRYTYTVIS